MADQQDDPLRPIRDKRGFFMLPRSPMESGYYNYGLLDKKPDRGGYQYPHPVMMQAILRVGLEWQAIDKRRIGIGNISRADGFNDRDHASHQDGLQVDIRPVRKDGLEMPVTHMDRQYDKDATAKVIELFRTFAPVKFVLFNDTSIPFVKWAEHHDDHFHVALIG
ncbi:penicillin-insensitive murein endopeptidase [Massilia norwichensis]|jgi:penicillin-insensitive murein DD-endopeptidase|uniref:Penicillin-insensitive murein endopeptidase n=1 Tax=Massilia norwichensis TaxID=1442366 RepID=A0ABT2ACU7_9BURK|nr:penicillin-insensitive murein endopeptidase [Massilia norwichensis]MCS0592039.1 penicillin-insensitive murein endopeptidase [Massilia norwichensis]